MRLKTTTTTTTTNASKACQDALLRGGFKPNKYNSQALCLGENKPGEVAYGAWFPRGYRWDLFVEIHKGTVAGSKTNSWVGWDWTNAIKLKLV